jgi:hypothetical protein
MRQYPVSFGRTLLWAFAGRAGGRRRSPSTIGRTCAPDAKKVIFEVALSELTCYHVRANKNLEDSDFSFQLPTFLCDFLASSYTIVNYYGQPARPD